MNFSYQLFYLLSVALTVAALCMPLMKFVEANGATGELTNFSFATAEGVGGVLPIDTGRHIYTHWTPIMEKRGALHPLMDPFKMEANRDIIPSYRADMCPETLDLLARTVYIAVDPQADTAALDARVAVLKAALS